MKMISRNRLNWNGWRGGGALLALLAGSALILRLAGDRSRDPETVPDPSPAPRQGARIQRAPDRTFVMRLANPTTFDHAVQLRRIGNRLIRRQTVRVALDGVVRFPAGSGWNPATDVIGLERSGRLVAWDEHWTWGGIGDSAWVPQEPVRLEVLFQLPAGFATPLVAQVHLLDEAGATVSWCVAPTRSTTDSAGVMILAGLPAAAAIRLTGIDPRLARAASLDRIPVGTESIRRTPRLRLELGSTVRGKLRGPTGKPLPSARVRVGRSATWGELVEVRTDRSGRFLVAGVSPGAYRLSFTVPNRTGTMLGAFPMEVTVRESAREIDLGTVVAMPAGRVAGTVRWGRNGNPLPGIQVRITARCQGKVWVEESLTSDDGRFEAAVPSGEVRVEARPVGGVPLPGSRQSIVARSVRVSNGETVTTDLWMGGRVR